MNEPIDLFDIPAEDIRYVKVIVKRKVTEIRGVSDSYRLEGNEEEATKEEYEDWNKQHMAETFVQKFKEGKEQSEKDEIMFKVNNYQFNIKKFYEKQPFFYDKARLFWKWNIEANKYEIIDEVDILNSVENALRLSGEIITNQQKSNYLEALRRVGRQHIPKEAPKQWIQFKNKIVDINTKEELLATPEYFLTNPIPQEIGESEHTPIMDKIFTQWVGLKYVATLYEILAYCLIRDYPIHRMFFLYGSGLNGKSKYLELLKKIIGQENTTSTELDTLLNSRFEVTRLHKKLVCLMGETDFTTIKRTSIIKKLTGEDLIGFEYKHKNPFDDYNYAKILIATNSLPITEDKTRGFFRRPLIIDFPNEFTEKKDILREIPIIEYSNLTRKSIRILHELLDKRQFSNEGTIEDRQQKYETRSNMLINFIGEKCTVDAEAEVPFTEFYSKFTKYCRENKARPISNRLTGKLLGNEGYERCPRTIYENDDLGGKKSTSHRIIIGLRFKEEKQGKLG